MLQYWLLFSLILIAMIYPASRLLPFNKRLFTLPYLFTTLSVSILTLSFFVIIIDLLPKKFPNCSKGISKITMPLMWMGLNPLAMFIVLQLLQDITLGWI
jgi:predicted acyltransferase